jgi:hypothetical protein
MGMMTISIREDLKDDFQVRCKDEGRTMSSVLADLMNAYLDEPVIDRRERQANSQAMAERVKAREPAKAIARKSRMTVDERAAKEHEDIMSELREMVAHNREMNRLDDIENERKIAMKDDGKLLAMERVKNDMADAGLKQWE